MQSQQFCGPEMDRELLVHLYGHRNASILLEAIPAYVGLLQSSPLDQSKPQRLVRKFVHELQNDLRGTISRYASLADAILASCVDASESAVTGDFLSEMKHTPVFREYLHFFRTGDVESLRFLVSFLFFLKKADLDFPDFEPAAFRDWLAIEDDLAQLTFVEHDLLVLRAAVRWLIDVNQFDDSGLYPKHGKGQVAERVREFNEKFRHLKLDPKLARVISPTRFGLVGADSYAGKRGKVGSSRWMSVPKSYKTYRSICMEPAAYMFFQQEVMRWLRDCMDRSRISAFVDLSDQSRNRLYALKGSEHKRLATIDLSAASDRVHIDIVKAVFPSKILFYLLGTRSNTVVTPDGATVRLNKFAPMGSALCFPTQCILFTAITMLGYVLQRQSCTLEAVEPESVSSLLDDLVDQGSFNPDYTRRYILPRVYGDDIICDDKVADDVTSLLERFGLVVNKSKSFVGGQSVRESCGIYAYNGYDITPFLYRVPSPREEAEHYPSLIDACNRAGDFGYRTLASVLRKRCEVLYWPVPYVTDKGAFGIWTKNKLYPKVTRPNVDLQLEEEPVVGLKGYDWRPFGNQRYLLDQWTRSKLVPGDEPYPMAQARTYPRHMGLAVVWTPLRM